MARDSVRGDLVRVAVLGVGAIGGLIAARLAATDADLLLYARGDTAQMLASVGMQLEAADGKMEHIALSSEFFKSIFRRLIINKNPTIK